MLEGDLRLRQEAQAQGGHRHKAQEVRSVTHRSRERKKIACLDLTLQKLAHHRPMIPDTLFGARAKSFKICHSPHHYARFDEVSTSLLLKRRL